MASCENCTKGHVLPGNPEGSIVDGAYFHPAAVSETTSGDSRAVVFLTDIFGLDLKNSKIMADELSKRLGCDVWVPDIFLGHPPVTPEDLQPLIADRPGRKKTLWDRLRILMVFVPRLFSFFGIRPSVVDARVTTFVNKLKEEKKYTKVGAVGYCFGGGIAVRLASTDVFDTVVIAHPGMFNMNHVKAIKVPACWVCAEEDDSFPKSMRDEAEAVFAGRKDKPGFIDYEFKDYDGVVHGFACRPNIGIPDILDAYNGALDQTTEWFKKTL